MATIAAVSYTHLDVYKRQSYGQISEIMARSVQDYLESILRQCHEIHELIYEIYVHYSIESALVG